LTLVPKSLLLCGCTFNSTFGVNKFVIINDIHLFFYYLPYREHLLNNILIRTWIFLQPRKILWQKR